MKFEELRPGHLLWFDNITWAIFIHKVDQKSVYVYENSNRQVMCVSKEEWDGRLFAYLYEPYTDIFTDEL